MNSTFPVVRLHEIAAEVAGLIGQSMIDSSGYTVYPLLEIRLQDLLQARIRYETSELAMYLRCSHAQSDALPSWQPLLNQAIEQGQLRGEQTTSLFYGLAPAAAHPLRNTR